MRLRELEEVYLSLAASRGFGEQRHGTWARSQSRSHQIEGGRGLDAAKGYSGAFIPGAQGQVRDRGGRRTNRGIDCGRGESRGGRLRNRSLWLPVSCLQSLVALSTLT